VTIFCSFIRIPESRVHRPFGQLKIQSNIETVIVGHSGPDPLQLWIPAGRQSFRDLMFVMLFPRAPSPAEGVGALEPPPGVTPDLKNPDTTVSKYNIACQVVCYMVVGASVLARTYTKIYIRPGLKVEDCESQLILLVFNVVPANQIQTHVYWVGFVLSV